MKTIIVGVYLILVFAPKLMLAESLDLEDFLTNVQQSHPYFKKEALNPDILKTQQKALLGEEDWRFNASTSLIHKNFGVINDFTPEISNYANLSTSISRIYWKTGGQLSLGYSFNRSSQDYTQGTFNSYQNQMNIQYVHPLMKNINGILSRLDYELQHYAIKSSELDALEAKESFLVILGDKYLDWLFQTELVRINAERLGLSEKEYKQSTRKHKKYLVSKVDVIRSKNAVLRAKQSLQQANIDLISIVTELSVISQNKNLAELKPSYRLYDVYAPPSTQTINQFITHNSRIVNIYDQRLNQIDDTLLALNNQKNPELNLIVGAGLLGSDNSLRDSASIDKPQYSVALNFNYPLGNRKIKATMDQSHLQKMQLEAEKKHLILQLQASVRVTLQKLTQLEKLLTLDKEQIESSELKTREELKRYHRGRSELTIVLQSQDQEQQAKISYAVTATTYHKVYLLYRSLMDELIEPINNNNNNNKKI